jgi:AcrR family transcriptional regulator
MYNHNMNSNNNPDLEPKKRIRKDRRGEILQAASTLFGAYGFQNTPLSRIAQAVGLTEPGVLHYFPSKVHLLQGVLEYQEQSGDAKYATMFGPDANVLERFLEVLEDSLTENQKDPRLARFFIVLVGESIQKDHPGQGIFVNRYERIRQLLIKELESRNDVGIPSNINLYEMASLILAVFDGLQIQWLLAPDKVDTVSIFKIFSKLLLENAQRNSTVDKSSEQARNGFSEKEGSKTI